MALWRLYYHLVWDTKDRLPLILPKYKDDLYNYIIGKSNHFGCIVHGVNGMPDHLHVIVSIPPKISISEYVQKIKGSTSHYLTEKYFSSFQWQKGYGVFSISHKNLDQAIAYVKNQKKHHANSRIITILEEIKNEDDPPLKYSQK
ncbi:probable transposase [Geminocystis sp. NIES-3708]|uniref:IS200/IS605 family transposase n=1 Tax=Geminocystis sp. NIES-3708 TaxID=1615909 RepID=UPI0005FC7B66|nr:IS200/IS605 family transposase [Geminocystis sp. NIES-3708]BAQ62992.1 probable transposase [Geminocystis sp. NIES-3708]